MNSKKNSAIKKILTGLLAVFIVGGSFTALTGCGSSDTPQPVDTSAAETTAAENETTTEKETEPETTAKETEAETTAAPETTAETTAAESTAAEETKAPSVTTPPTTDKPASAYIGGKEDKSDDGDSSGNSNTIKAVEIGEGVNPLTGIHTGNDYENKRPVAIMINNIKASLPQVGISEADILYECLVEGGLTRLMMVKMDYEDLDVTGSVRSSRDYYIDLAQNHDAIYVHAGGSNDAYTAIQERKINNLDGVNMYLPSTFYRDEERRKIMSVEHTLVTTGKGIVEGIKYKKYRTELRSGFKSPFAFASEDEQLTLNGGKPAKHVIITYNNYAYPQYIYNANSQLYTRYQYKGEDHIDGTTGERLTFKNIILLVCDHSALNDDKNHIAIDTTGTGKGYYITNGRYVEIKWSKADRDSNLVLTNTDGSQLVINAGNTMVNIISPSVAKNMFFNYTAAEK
nr:DUF3048 domain-containing protein [Clostridia bacterium]